MRKHVSDLRGLTDLKGLVLLIALGLLAASCAKTHPAPVPIATVTPTLTPSATFTPPPSTTPLPTSTPTPALVQLTTGGCCVQPFWSLDSRQVQYIDKPSPNEPAAIYAVDVVTGALKPPQRVGRIGLYSPDRSLIANRENAKTVIERLSTGEKWTLSHPGQIVFAPDNQHLAWDEGDTQGPYDQQASDMYVANLDGTNVVRVKHMYGGGLVGWLPRGFKIVFLGRPSLDVRERTLTVLDLTTQAAVNLVTAERISGIVASKDGTWIAYYITFDADPSRNGIWAQRTDGSQARRLELFGGYQWRDDAHLLVIPMRPSSDRPFEVWEVDAASGANRKLTDSSVTPLRILNGDWRVSPDGRRIVYVNSVDRNLWMLTLPAR